MKDIDAQLRKLAKGNEEYVEFNKRIVNTKKQLLGVRTPDLRNLAKQTAKEMATQDIEKLIKAIHPGIYEHVMLVGMIINLAKISELDQIKLTRTYLGLVDSWAEIDIFASKKSKFDHELWWEFVNECLSSSDEYTVRFGIVFMMANFLTPEYIKRVFEKLRQVKHTGYYVKMAQAWLYATSAIDFYESTLAELRNQPLDAWTVRKSYQKMVESRQFSDEQKSQIRLLRDMLKSRA